jgi:hypothetical protein
MGMSVNYARTSTSLSEKPATGTKTSPPGSRGLRVRRALLNSIALLKTLLVWIPVSIQMLPTALLNSMLNSMLNSIAVL